MASRAAHWWGALFWVVLIGFTTGGIAAAVMGARYSFTYPTTCVAPIACPFGDDGVTKHHLWMGRAGGAKCVQLRDAMGVESDGVFYDGQQGNQWLPESYPHACHTDGGNVWEADPYVGYLASVIACAGAVAIGSFVVGVCAACASEDDPRTFAIPMMGVALCYFILFLVAILVTGAGLAGTVANNYVQTQCAGYAPPQDPSTDMSVTSVWAIVGAVGHPTLLAVPILDLTWRPAPESFPQTCYVNVPNGVGLFNSPSQIMQLELSSTLLILIGEGEGASEDARLLARKRQIVVALARSHDPVVPEEARQPIE